ncbi:hypothetical protein PFISCL1PPCAC_19372, partial [Pristionchus fissidentatus]
HSPFQNGSWTGALGQIMAGDFDLACLFYQLSENRLRDFHYSPSFQRTQFILVSRLKTELMPPSLRSPYEVWIAILVSVFIQSISLFFVGRYVEDQVHSNQRLQHRRWETFTTVEEAAALIETGELVLVMTPDG